MKELTLEEWLGKDNKLGVDVFNKKYRHNDETFDNWLNRVSGKNIKVREMIVNKKAIFGGRVLANRGTGLSGGLSNCYVLPSRDIDSIDGILEQCKRMANTFKHQGGLGFDLSAIRPRGSYVNGDKTTAPGAISFMPLFSSVTGTIASGGRRGASLLFINARHPDAIEFCECKRNKDNGITNANISLMVDDEFMEKAKNGIVEKCIWKIKSTGQDFEYELDYKAVIDSAVQGGLIGAEPACLFKDHYINNAFTQHIKELEFTGVNGCVTGDTLILTDKGNVRIDSIIGDATNIWNGYEWSEVIPKITGYNKEIYLVKFNNGVELQCTDNHKFILEDGSRVNTLQLKEGYKMKKHSYPVITRGLLNLEHPYTQGAFSGDGSISNNKAILPIYGDKSVMLPRLNYLVHNKSANGGHGNDTNLEGVNGRISLSVNIDFIDKSFVPNDNYSVKSKIEWLSGLLDTDGHITKSNGGQISSIDLQFLKNVQLLLTSLGVKSRVCKAKDEQLVKFKEGQKFYMCKDLYRLIFPSVGTRQLLSLGMNLSRCKINYIHLKKSERENTQFVQVESVVKTGIIADNVYCVTEPKNNSVVFNGIMTGNCSEFSGTDWSACMLASMNVSQYIKNKKFMAKEFFDDTKEMFNELNKVLKEGFEYHPYQEMRDVARNQRQVGMGITGIADALIKLGITYGTKESKDFVELVGEYLLNACVQASALQAKEDGSFEHFDIDKVSDSMIYKKLWYDTKELVEKHGMYNSRLVAVAPQGSGSLLLGCSSGIEPIYKRAYQRRTQSLHGTGEDVIYTVIHQPIVEYMSENNLETIPSHCVEAHDINWKDKIDIIASLQKYCDNAISNTTNLPKGTTFEELKDIYFYGHSVGCKGISVYVDGSLDSQVLFDDTDTESVEKDSKKGLVMDIDESLLVAKRVKLKHGCGKFTAHVYFYNDKVFDVFVSTKQAGCIANIQTVAVTYSLLIRMGMSLAELKRYLSGVSTCASFAVAKSKDFSMDMTATSCGTMLINKLIEMENAIQQSDIKNEIKLEKIDNVNIDVEGLPCKVCGHIIEIKENCTSCPKCHTVNCG